MLCLHYASLSHFAPPFILCHRNVFYISFHTISSTIFGKQDINEIKNENEHDLMVVPQEIPLNN